MGGSQSTGLDAVRERAEGRTGTPCVSGRFHRLPRRLHQDYSVASTVLGKGHNGAVYLATNKHTGQLAAVKGFRLLGMNAEQRKDLETECEVFLQMDHPHVGRLVDVYESETKLDLVMECLSGGELFKRVVEKKRFSETDARDVSWQMLLAINYIHSRNVVHRDIKLENFMFDAEGSDHIKLIDFGFSKIWKPNTKMALGCGTLSYVAPDVLKQSYTSQCDMWSFGVTVFIVLFGYMPFQGPEKEQIKDILAGRYNRKESRWSKVSQDAQDLVEKLLVVDPLRRLTARQALEHTWIKARDQFDRSLSIADATDAATANALVSFAHASQFRRAALHMMAWSLTNEERAQVRKAFISMDVNRTGAITASEFKQILEEQFQINDEQVSEAFKALDANNQDEIHYSEFLAAMVSSRIKIHDELLQATFKRFDKDNSGYITEENLRQVLGNECSPELIEAMIRDVDKAKDGQISYQEFIAYLSDSNAESEHQEAVARMIDQSYEKNMQSGCLLKSHKRANKKGCAAAQECRCELQ